MLWVGRQRKVEVHGRCTKTQSILRFGDFLSKMSSYKTSSSLSPVVTTPRGNSRRQNGMETPEEWIFTSKQFNRSEWIYERRLKYFVVVNKPRCNYITKVQHTLCTSPPHWVHMSSSQYVVRCDHRITGIKFCRSLYQNDYIGKTKLSFDIMMNQNLSRQFYMKWNELQIVKLVTLSS